MNELREGRAVQAVLVPGRRITPTPGARITMEPGQGGYVPFVRWEDGRGVVVMYNAGLCEEVQLEPEAGS